MRKGRISLILISGNAIYIDDTVYVGMLGEMYVCI